MKGLTTSQIAELNLKHAKNHLIVGDSAEPRLLHELKAKGCNVVKAIKGQGSITYGIALLQDYDLDCRRKQYQLNQRTKQLLLVREKV